MVSVLFLINVYGVQGKIARTSSNLQGSCLILPCLRNGKKITKFTLTLYVLFYDKLDRFHLIGKVTAAANLRACVFHLDLSSRFFVKEQAGNIIPAIATTNAIAAGTSFYFSFDATHHQD
jgi:hypothetical protein